MNMDRLRNFSERKKNVLRYHVSKLKGKWLRHELEHSVKFLPKTEQQIYQFLKKRDILGYRANSVRCPLANYIRKDLKVSTVSVTGSRISVSKGDAYAFIRLPEALSLFVDHFDSGFYPELETEQPL